MEGFEKRIVKKFKIAGLFPYQKDALAIICGGESVFVCQRTGRGKVCAIRPLQPLWILRKQLF